jgi:hypothetical protein
MGKWKINFMPPTHFLLYIGAAIFKETTMPEHPFTNENLDLVTLNSLPEIHTLKWERLSEKYAALNLLVNILSTLFITILGALVYFQPWFPLPNFLVNYLPYLLILVTLIALSFCALGYVADQYKRYALRELDLHFSCGLIFRKTLSQPITRIQHIELKQGPLERYKDLATLQVFSAGGAMHTFEIPGLALHKAQYLRQFILQHRDLALHG